MHKFHLRPVLGHLAFWGVMGLALDGQAATSPTIAQSSITLSNFAYKVTDLNTSDGVTASATFDTSNTGGGVGMYVADFLNSSAIAGGTVKFVAGTPFTSSNATQTVSGITASASKKGSTFSTSASYALSNLTGQIDAQTAGMKDFFEISRQASISEYSIFVTLSAHSSIQFSGTVSSSSLITPDGFLATSSFAKVANAQAAVTLGAYSGVSVGLQDVNVPIDPLPSDGPQYVGLGSGMRTSIDALGHILVEDSTSPVSQNFTLNFTNDSNQSVDKELVFEVTTGLYAFTTPVPEPSSMALMGLGLSVLGWSVSRRRNKTKGVQSE